MKKSSIPTCPFCGRPIKKPEYLPIGFSDLEAGICECGSVYVCDVTGHNRGAAFVEALVIACAGDWDLAWDLVPDEDYKEIWVENYDISTHSILPVPTYGRKRLTSALCFIKLSEDIREAKKDRLKELLNKETSEELPRVEKKKLSKKEVEKLIINNEIDLLTAYAIAEPLNLNVIQKLLYHPDPGFRKRVAIAAGKVAARVSKFHPERVLEFIKRLIYAAADSAASAWGALETVGEVIRHTGDRYSLFIRNLLAFMQFPEYRPYLLYGFYRISQVNPKVLKSHSYLLLLNYFEDSPPEVQGLMLLTFKNLDPASIKPYLGKVKKDAKFKLFDYDAMDFKEVSLGDILKEFQS